MNRLPLLLFLWVLWPLLLGCASAGGPADRQLNLYAALVDLEAALRKDAATGALVRADDTHLPASARPYRRALSAALASDGSTRNQHQVTELLTSISAAYAGLLPTEPNGLDWRIISDALILETAVGREARVSAYVRRSPGRILDYIDGPVLWGAALSSGDEIRQWLSYRIAICLISGSISKFDKDNLAAALKARPLRAEGEDAVLVQLVQQKVATDC